MNIPTLTTRLLLGQRLPKTQGQLQLAGIQAPVTIRRDRYGIPYIQAGHEGDAWFGLGFCQGQDRPFQLEMLLRVCRGSLAELIGAAGLATDRLSRRIGFYRAAEGHYQVLGAEQRALLDAFAAGISAGARAGLPKKAHAFALLQAEPTPWTAVNVLAGMNYIGFGLSNWSAKVSRLIVLQRDGPAALKAIDPDYAEWLPATQLVNLPSGPSLDRLAQDLSALSAVLGLQGGSNNWALQAARTQTGRPLVANDPHLWPSIPAPWYLAHLEAPGLKVAGASFVGAPVIPSGHNQHAAWGVTAGLVDNIDLFMEQFSQDGLSVRDGDDFVPCQVLDEIYLVKGQQPFKEQIRITPRGPIVSDQLTGADQQVLSMQATWFTPRPANGMLDLHRCHDFESFHRAAGEVYLASQNMVYADTSDQIGWLLMGEVPARRSGHGALPMPGWDSRFTWQPEFVPFAKMPFTVSPETGFVASANARPIPEGDGPYLGRGFADGYRHARIVEQLATRSDWNLERTQRLQLDQFLIPWREIKGVVLKLTTTHPDTRLALDLLANWDGVASAGSNAALVYEYFMMEMQRRITQAKAPNAGDWALGKGFHPLVMASYFPMHLDSFLVRLMKHQPEQWFEHGWPAEIEAALAAVIARLRERFGPRPAQWAWGQAHQLTLRHALGGRPRLAAIFNRGPFASGGDGNTISQAGRANLEWGANVTVMANLRNVMDVGNWDDNRIVIAGGQSGNPFSPHYDDLLQLWLRGEAVSMPWTEEAVAQATRQTLQLTPVPAR